MGMSTKVLGCVVGVGFAFMACGSSSPSDACNKLAQVLCQKAYECATPQELAAAGYTSESDCESKQKSAYDCENPIACPNGGVYHGDQADQCLSNYQNATCGQIEGKTVDTTPCTKTCQTQ